MIIVMIWLGSMFPDKYLDVVKNCTNYETNRCVILQEVHWDYLSHKYKDMLNLTQHRTDRLILVEKVDILRLLYLYDKGGIYTDLDNVVNYTCLDNFTKNVN